MGQAIAVRTDYTAKRFVGWRSGRRMLRQARRLLAIAAVLDGASRAEAARIGGMDRQTLRDWVIRFNEQGPDGLINKPCAWACRPSSATNTRRFSLAWLRRGRCLRSTASCAGGRAI